jgi:hypothetical protein
VATPPSYPERRLQLLQLVPRFHQPRDTVVERDPVAWLAVSGGSPYAIVGSSVSTCSCRYRSIPSRQRLNHRRILLPLALDAEGADLGETLVQIESGQVRDSFRNPFGLIK